MQLKCARSFDELQRIVELTERFFRQHDIDQVVFAYSDVSHEYVMHKASVVLAAGFRPFNPAPWFAGKPSSSRAGR